MKNQLCQVFFQSLRFLNEKYFDAYTIKSKNTVTIFSTHIITLRVITNFSHNRFVATFSKFHFRTWHEVVKLNASTYFAVHNIKKETAFAK